MKKACHLQMFADNLSIDVGGKLTIENIEFHTTTSINNEINGMSLILTISVKCQVNGVELEKYMIINKHSLNAADFRSLMENFKNNG